MPLRATRRHAFFLLFATRRSLENISDNGFACVLFSSLRAFLVCCREGKKRDKPHGYIRSEPWARPAVALIPHWTTRLVSLLRSRCASGVPRRRPAASFDSRFPACAPCVSCPLPASTWADSRGSRRNPSGLHCAPRLASCRR